MSDKSRDMLRIIVGGYLCYLGGSLFLNAWQEKPDNYVLFLLAGIFFIAVGVAVAIKSLKTMMTTNNMDDVPDDEESDDEESDDEESIGQESIGEETKEQDTKECKTEEQEADEDKNVQGE
ncbi:MAG: hypothetical protein RR920_06695 [Lachnospiraceae bacterium]